jgi:hypothetical protein
MWTSLSLAWAVLSRRHFQAPKMRHCDPIGKGGPAVRATAKCPADTRAPPSAPTRQADRMQKPGTRLFDG